MYVYSYMLLNLQNNNPRTTAGLPQDHRSRTAPMSGGVFLVLRLFFLLLSFNIEEILKRVKKKEGCR
jgi:hypothetical protein